MDQFQTLQRQQRVDPAERFRMWNDQFGESASGYCGDLRGFGRTAQLLLYPLDDTIDQAGKAEDDPGAQRCRRGFADDCFRLAQIDAGQPRRPRGQSLQRNLDPGAIAPPRYSPAAEMAQKVVAVPKSTTTQGPPSISSAATALTMRSRPYLVRIVGKHRQPGLQARSDNHRLRPQTGFRKLLIWAYQRRHYRGNNSLPHINQFITLERQQEEKKSGQLVGGHL